MGWGKARNKNSKEAVSIIPEINYGEQNEDSCWGDEDRGTDLGDIWKETVRTYRLNVGDEEEG